VSEKPEIDAIRILYRADKPEITLFRMVDGKSFYERIPDRKHLLNLIEDAAAALRKLDAHDNREQERKVR
jgi:hypothetical protein